MIVRYQIMLCPYCKKAFAKDMPFGYYSKSYEDHVIRRMKRSNIMKIPEKYRSYECPRCKGKFTTKESFHEINPEFKIKYKIIKQYEKRSQVGKFLAQNSAISVVNFTDDLAGKICVPRATISLKGSFWVTA